MVNDRQRRHSGIRITLAIAAKDILDSIKNRVMIGVIIGVAGLMLGTFALRILVGTDPETLIVIAGPGGRELVRELREQGTFRGVAVEDRTALLAELQRSARPSIGVVLPSDSTSDAAPGESVRLETYVPHWLRIEDVLPALRSFQDDLETMKGYAVEMDANRRVYPALETVGYPVMIASGFVNAVLIIGVVMTPTLIMEERQVGTMTALLVSPAGWREIALGKALAGMTYALAAGVLFALFARPFIVRWELLALASLLGSALAVSIGLACGSFVEETGPLNLLLGLAMLILLVPVFMGVVDLALPRGVALGLSWLPSMALSELVRMSMMEVVENRALLLDVLRLLAPTLLFLALAGWRIGRMDR